MLILKYDATEMVAGGAGNAANNVAALGGRARLAGLVGADPEGRRLLGSFHRGVDRRHVVRARGYRTPVKTRILAGGVHAARQQVVRIDRETGWPLDESVSAALAAKIAAGARRLRRRAAVRLRIRTRRRRRSPTPSAARSRAARGAARCRCCSTPAIGCSITAA